MFNRRNETLEQIARGVDAVHEELARIREEARADRERSDKQWREQLHITREVIRRNELAFQESRTALSHVLGRMDAQTKALFALINRLNDGAQPGPA